MQPKQEVGRELNAKELTPKKIVVIQPPGRNQFLTMWVDLVTPELVSFYAGVMKWTVINFVRPDGTICDDQGRQVHVFEYLGEP